MRRDHSVELIYDRDCPNIARARTMLRAALEKLGAAPVWKEWDREDPATPAERRQYGSPTVLVDGQDVGCDEQGSAQVDGSACRVYPDEHGCLCGAPSAALIADAIERADVA